MKNTIPYYHFINSTESYFINPNYYKTRSRNVKDQFIKNYSKDFLFFNNTKKNLIKTPNYYENMKNVIKKLGKSNKEYKASNEELQAYKNATEKEIEKLRAENKKLKEANKKLGSIAIEQRYEAKNSANLISIKTEESQECFEQNKKLESKLNQKEIQEKKLHERIGELEYKLTILTDIEQKYTNMENQIEPLKDLIKSQTTKLKIFKETEEKMNVNLKKQTTEIEKLMTELKFSIERINEQEAEITEYRKNTDKKYEALKSKCQEMFKQEKQKCDEEIKELKNSEAEKKVKIAKFKSENKRIHEQLNETKNKQFKNYRFIFTQQQKLNIETSL
jgi:chromosome segregation ATPase